MLAVLGAIRDMADDQGRCTATDARITQFAGVSRGSMHVAIKRAQHRADRRRAQAAQRQARDHQ
jgi:hypothetical protein